MSVYIKSSNNTSELSRDYSQDIANLQTQINTLNSSFN